MTQEYLTLFSAISDALERLDALRALLVAAQQTAEERYIRRGE